MTSPSPSRSWMGLIERHRQPGLRHAFDSKTQPMRLCPPALVPIWSRDAHTSSETSTLQSFLFSAASMASSVLHLDLDPRVRVFWVAGFTSLVRVTMTSSFRLLICLASACFFVLIMLLRLQSSPSSHFRRNLLLLFSKQVVLTCPMHLARLAVPRWCH